MLQTLVTTTPLARLRGALTTNHPALDGLFVTQPENRAYVSGFTGSYGYLLVTKDEAVLFTDGRYIEQAQAQAPGWAVVRLQRPYEEALMAALKRLDVQRLGFESDHLSHADYASWTQKLPSIEWKPTIGIVAQLRRYKTPQEVAAIRQAVAIVDNAFATLLNFLRPGLTERQVAAELEYAMRRGGADAVAFETIVVSGARGALPHGRPEDKEIEAGDLVTIDFGARYAGYNSDITRTVFVGGGKQPTDRQREIYTLVQQVQQAGVEAVRPGVKCSAVDQLCRNMFEQAGLADYFVHGLGHSLGREVHEFPMLVATDDTLIEPGLVLTVEPGLYIKEWGGVRIEDDLCVGENGTEVLSRTTRELILL